MMDWLFNRPRWVHRLVRALTGYRLMARMQEAPGGRVRVVRWVRRGE
jgi:hypothetical protein